MFWRKKEEIDFVLDQCESLLSSADISVLRQLRKKKQIGVANKFYQTSVRTLTFPQFFTLIQHDYIQLLITINEDLKRHFISEQITHDLAKKLLQHAITGERTDISLLYKLCIIVLFSEKTSIGVFADSRLEVHDVLSRVALIHPKAFESVSGNVRTTTKSKGILEQVHQGLLVVPSMNQLNNNDISAIVKSYQTDVYEYTLKKEKQFTESVFSIIIGGSPRANFIVGKQKDIIQKQISFSPKLMEIFDVMAILRFEEPVLAPKVLTEDDINTIRLYIEHALKIDVSFPEEFKQYVVSWYEKMVHQDYIFPVQKNVSALCVRYSKAFARSRLSDSVKLEDLKLAMDTIQLCFESR